MAGQVKHTVTTWAAQDDIQPWRLALAQALARSNGLNPADEMTRAEWEELLAQTEAHHVAPISMGGQ